MPAIYIRYTLTAKSTYRKNIYKIKETIILKTKIDFIQFLTHIICITQKLTECYLQPLIIFEPTKKLASEHYF